MTTVAEVTFNNDNPGDIQTTAYRELPTWKAYTAAKAKIEELQAAYWMLSDEVYEKGKDELMPELKMTGMALEKAIKTELTAFESFCQEWEESKKKLVSAPGNDNVVEVRMAA